MPLRGAISSRIFAAADAATYFISMPARLAYSAASARRLRLRQQFCRSARRALLRMMRAQPFRDMRERDARAAVTPPCCAATPCRFERFLHMPLSATRECRSFAMSRLLMLRRQDADARCCVICDMPPLAAAIRIFAMPPIYCRLHAAAC